MPTPLSLPVRQAIHRRAQQGQDAVTIAQALQLRPRSVRNLLYRFRQQPEALPPDYRAGPGRPATSVALRERALALREQHPRWGAGYIRVRLALAQPEQTVPTERTLQRWFRQHQQPVAPPGRRAPTEATRALQPHQTWQMDAVEQLRLGSGQGVCWLRLVDECSGAFLSTTIFPPLPLGSCRGGGRTTGLAAGVRSLGSARAVASR